MEVTSESREMAAPLEAIFGVVIDVERYPQWASDIRSVEVLERDELGRARLVRFRAGAFGRSATYTLAYDLARAPREVSWRQVEGDVTERLDGRYSFEPLDEASTRVTYELAADLVVPLPGFLKRRAEMKIVHAALEDLARRVAEVGRTGGSSVRSPERHG
jgi:ribosome-associated toxin RatA of RatAB toxin-antitoxin module